MPDLRPAARALRPAARAVLAAAAHAAPGRRALQFYANNGLVPPPAPGAPAAPPPAGPTSAELVAGAPTEMSVEERGFLFALVRGAQPRRILEIGTSEGGSGLVMAAALADNGGDGRIWTIDPMPRIAFDHALFAGRVEVVVGTSPEAVDRVATDAPGPFDLVVIDGIHIHRQARADLLAVRPHLADGAYVLLHDAFHVGVSEAVREIVAADDALHDCGFPCNRPRPVGERATHAGFRLLRFGAPVVDSTALVAPMWAQLGIPAPVLPSQINHDFWYCSAIEACDYCREHGPDPLLG